MNEPVRKRCPECKMLVKVLWEQIHGMRLLKEKNGKDYYSAKCPECGFHFDVKKQTNCNHI